jgi:hypothetical protein
LSFSSDLSPALIGRERGLALALWLGEPAGRIQPLLKPPPASSCAPYTVLDPIRGASVGQITI